LSSRFHAEFTVSFTHQTETSLSRILFSAPPAPEVRRHALFRPSLTYYLLKDPLRGEYHAPKEESVDERRDELRMQRGMAHEEQWSGKPPEP
jgi:hypothetical protein